MSQLPLKHSEVTTRILHKQKENIDPFCFVSRVQPGDDCVILWEIIPSHTLAKFLPIYDRICATVQLVILTELVI